MRSMWKALKQPAFVAVVVLMAIPAFAKPPAGKGGGGGGDGGGGDGGTAEPRPLGQLYYQNPRALWRAPADGSSPPELVSRTAWTIFTNMFDVSNYTYSGEPWFVGLRPSGDKYVLDTNGTRGEVEPYEVYAVQFHADGTSSDPIRLTDTYGSSYYLDVDGEQVVWDKTGSDQFLICRALEMSQRLTGEVSSNGEIVLDQTKGLRSVIVAIPIAGADIYPGMTPAPGNSFAEVFEVGSYDAASGWTWNVGDKNWVSIDPLLEFVASVNRDDSGTPYAELFHAATGMSLSTVYPTWGNNVVWSSDGGTIGFTGYGAELETAKVGPDGTVSERTAVAPVGKSHGVEVVGHWYPRFSPGGGHLMYLTQENTKGSSTDFLRIGTADGVHTWTIDSSSDNWVNGNFRPLRWIEGTPPPSP